MNIKTKIGSSLILVILFIILIYTIPISNSALYYNGTYENFQYHGQDSSVTFKAGSINFYSNIFTFQNIKNVNIMKKGDDIFYNNSNVRAEYNKGYSESFSDADFKIFFSDSFIERIDPNQFRFYGNLNKYYNNKIELKNGSVIIDNDEVSFLQINGENVSDFSYVTFEIDDTSDVYFEQDFIIIDAYNVSEINVDGQLLEIDLRGNGIMWLDDRPYNIESNDLKVKSNLNYLSSSDKFNIEERGMEFNTIAKSATVNNKNIMKGLLVYWFDQTPEKINTIAALILAVITLMYVFFTMGILEQTKATVIQSETSIKQTEKIIKLTKAEKIFDDNEKLLMFVYSPMEVILTKFNLSLDHIFLTTKSHKIPDEYDQLFKKMNADLLEIKRNYGYLLDNEVLQYHYNVCDLWKQYLDSEESKKKIMYMALNSRIIALHNSITIKINEAKNKRDEIVLSFDS